MFTLPLKKHTQNAAPREDHKDAVYFPTLGKLCTIFFIHIYDNNGIYNNNGNQTTKYSDLPLHSFILVKKNSLISKNFSADFMISNANQHKKGKCTSCTKLIDGNDNLHFARYAKLSTHTCDMKLHHIDHHSYGKNTCCKPKLVRKLYLYFANNNGK